MTTCRTADIVLGGLQVLGGSGFTPESMEEAVALIETGRVNTEAVRGEVFTLDGIGEVHR